VLALVASACAIRLPCDGPSAPGDIAGMLDAVDVSMGLELSCALRSGGAVACWGRDAVGQVGDGAQVERTGPTAVLGITDAVEVVAEGTFACVRRSDGRVSCWGSNASGALGTSLVAHCRCTGVHCLDSLVPIDAAGITDAIQIAAGSQHVCALRAGGTVSCWGGATGGLLGDGLDHHESCGGGDLSVLPVTVMGLTDAVEITPRCARRAGGSVVCWGSFTGDGTNAVHLSPVPVVGLTDAVEVVSGLAHTCARRAAGSVVCWGLNGEGQLGGGVGVSGLAPVGVGALSDALELAVGAQHTCARRATDVVCWGANAAGQLGDGTTANRMLPTEVLDIGVVAHIAAGFSHTCAVRTDGTVTCWGSNECGQLGDGTRTPRARPGDVVTE
jgi:alpha-tubulin suppressor-like RCC1 family protein